MRPLLTAVMPTFPLTTPLPPEGEPEGFWGIASDLLIEVVSSSETAQIVHEKVVDYAQLLCRGFAIL